MNKTKELISNVSDITKLIFFIGGPLVGLFLQVQVLSSKVDGFMAQRSENIITMESQKKDLVAKIDACCSTANTVKTKLDSYILYNK